MADDLHILDLDIRVTERGVLRYMGYPRSATPSKKVGKRLGELWRACAGLVMPRGVFRMATRAQAEAAGMPQASARVGLGLCTIGPALEEEGRLAGEGGRALDALIMDSFGSAAAEAAADALNEQLCTHARAQSQRARARVSPGYGRWGIDSQPSLLGLLAADKLGIKLTSGLMMTPRKSVSFAVRLEQYEGAQERDTGRCARCGLENCAYRVEPEMEADAP